MQERRYIRQIVEEELNRTNRDITNQVIQNYVLRNHIRSEINDQISSLLNPAVNNAVLMHMDSVRKSITIDSMDAIDRMLANDARMQQVTKDAAEIARNTIAPIIEDGKLQIQNVVKREVNNILRSDRYNTLNDAFLNDLSVKCSKSITDINNHSMEQLTKLNNSHLAHEKKVLDELEMMKQSQMKMVIGSSVCGALLGTGLTFCIQTYLKK